MLLPDWSFKDIAATMEAEGSKVKKSDSEFVFYNRDKSHNTSFYKKTPGVCTSSKQELESISRTTGQTLPLPHLDGDGGGHPPDKDRYWTEPGDLLKDVLNNNLPSIELPVVEVMDVVEELNLHKRKKKKKKQKPRVKSGNLSREIARNSKKFSEKVQIESLKQVLGDPWEEISFDEKKKFGLHFYYNHLQEVGSEVGGKHQARVHAGKLIGISGRTIGVWVREFELKTYLVESRRGKHSKTVSPITNADFREEFKSYVKENSRKSGTNFDFYLEKYWFIFFSFSGEANLNTSDLASWVNDRLELNDGNTYSESKEK